MTLLLVVVDASHADAVQRVIDAYDVAGFTEIPEVFGRGTTGRKFGSRVFPGSSTLYWLVAPRETIDAVVTDLRALDRRIGEVEAGLKAYVLPTEEVI